MKLCDYGCGQEAKYPFKNGKWCCSKNWMSCPFKRNKTSIQMKVEWKNPNSIFNTNSFREKRSNIMKEVWEDSKSSLNSLISKMKISDKIKDMWNDPASIYNSEKFREKKSDSMKDVWKNPDSKLNSILRSKKISDIIAKNWKNPDSKYNSNLYKENRKNLSKLTIKKINKRYPFFSKIEEMRYNNNKEIQVHCKNHECENSKEKDGWFVPTYTQLGERIRQLESKEGNGGSYFYCSQHCKDTCSLYNLHGDPFKNNILPYTASENQLWRQIVLKLDKGLCQFCGKPATDVHHIKPVKTHPHLVLDPDNGISFCEDCHYKIGHQGECSTGNLAKVIQQGCVLGSQL